MPCSVPDSALFVASDGGRGVDDEGGKRAGHTCSYRRDLVAAAQRARTVRALRQTATERPRPRGRRTLELARPAAALRRRPPAIDRCAIACARAPPRAASKSAAGNVPHALARRASTASSSPMLAMFESRRRRGGPRSMRRRAWRRRRLEARPGGVAVVEAARRRRRPPRCSRRRRRSGSCRPSRRWPPRRRARAATSAAAAARSPPATLCTSRARRSRRATTCGSSGARRRRGRPSCTRACSTCGPTACASSPTATDPPSSRARRRRRCSARRRRARRPSTTTATWRSPTTAACSPTCACATPRRGSAVDGPDAHRPQSRTRRWRALRRHDEGGAPPTRSGLRAAARPARLRRRRGRHFRGAVSGSHPALARVVSARGAGKTESARKVLALNRCVARGARCDHTRGPRRAAPLGRRVVGGARGVGNAATGLNHDLEQVRPRKGLRLRLTADGRVDGADLSSYLLEKSRLAATPRAERNFHALHRSSPPPPPPSRLVLLGALVRNATASNACPARAEAAARATRLHFLGLGRRGRRRRRRRASRRRSTRWRR